MTDPNLTFDFMEEEMKTKTKTKSRPTSKGFDFTHLFNVLNREADKLEVNTLPEVRVTTSKMLRDIAIFAAKTYADFGISTDNLPYTPKFERLINTINAKFGVCLGGWHVWQVLLRARKNSLLPLSGTSRKSGTLVKTK
jgi:hypothetical protein